MALTDEDGRLEPPSHSPPSSLKSPDARYSVSLFRNVRMLIFSSSAALVRLPAVAFRAARMACFSIWSRGMIESVFKVIRSSPASFKPPTLPTDSGYGKGGLAPLNTPEFPALAMEEAAADSRVAGSAEPLVPFALAPFALLALRG